jgi:nucleotide-binding universal stress UspA family protein
MMNIEMIHMDHELPELGASLGLKIEREMSAYQAYLQYLQDLFPDKGLSFRSDLHYPFLFVPKPRWPVEEILYILRGSKHDLKAIRWMAQLAVRCQANVTILAICPDIPALYNVNPDVQLDLRTLLQLDNDCGRMLRAALDRLEQSQVSGELSLQKGTPDEQIRSQVEQRDYDLVLITRESQQKITRLWLGEIVRPMLRWIERPVIVV